MEGFYVRVFFWVFDGFDIVGVCIDYFKCEHVFYVIGKVDHMVI